MKTLWKVKNGIEAWRNKVGEFVLLDATNNEMVIRLKSFDDCGESVYDVRMPIACVEEVRANEKA